WVTKNAPFDVAAHFADIPDAENAAPLYLDVLYEFAPQDMQTCVSPEDRTMREPVLKERAARTAKLQVLDPQTFDPALRSGIVDEYEESFNKLAQAQKRQRCIFETGLGIDAMVPHVQGARAAVRL